MAGGTGGDGGVNESFFSTRKRMSATKSEQDPHGGCERVPEVLLFGLEGRW